MATQRFYLTYSVSMLNYLFVCSSGQLNTISTSYRYSESVPSGFDSLEISTEGVSGGGNPPRVCKKLRLPIKAFEFLLHQRSLHFRSVIQCMKKSPCMHDYLLLPTSRNKE